MVGWLALPLPKQKCQDSCCACDGDGMRVQGGGRSRWLDGWPKDNVRPSASVRRRAAGQTTLNSIFCNREESGWHGWWECIGAAEAVATTTTTVIEDRRSWLSSDRSLSADRPAGRGEATINAGCDDRSGVRSIRGLLVRSSERCVSPIKLKRRGAGLLESSVSLPALSARSHD